MKKFLVFFLALAVSFSAFGHGGATGGSGREYHDGITAGVEFGVLEIEEEGANEPIMAFTLAFAQPFFNNQLELLAEGRYIFGLGEDYGDGDTNQALDLFLGLTYNRKLSDAATLSFLLQKGFEGIVLSDRDDDANNIGAARFTPAVRFGYEFPVEDSIYLQFSFPWTYAQNTKNAANIFGFDLTLGWESNFGLNLEATLATIISPFNTTGENPNNNVAWRNHTGIQFLEFVVGYEYRAFHFEVATEIPVNASNRNANNTVTRGAGGVIITPEIEFHIHALGGVITAYVNCEFDHAGRKGAIQDSMMHISPAAGLMFTYQF